ncbi:MAG: hypothetical protein EOP84_20635 [Verrucomicrobiaceae bacterium]|nr:MAG: hypothetical protein EOP84_20635 [Verrucomicrobiaceae bacterium]
MLFNDEARRKLDAIIHGAAVGETVGLLASRMSEAERAEKLTPEGILQLSRQSDLTSTSAEMLRATIQGLEAAEAMGSPSNLDILIQLHRGYWDWASTSPLASQFRNARLREALVYGQLGSFTPIERGGCDGMLCVAPIGLAFADDPGRAFELGAKAAALSDADFNSGLAAGVVTLLFALTGQGMSIREAIADITAFIRRWIGRVRCRTFFGPFWIVMRWPGATRTRYVAIYVWR